MIEFEKPMPIKDYMAEFYAGKHQTEYNICRFCDDKEKFAREWLEREVPGINLDNPQNIVDRIGYYKIYDRNPIKQDWTDKITALELLRNDGLSELRIEPVFTDRNYLTEHNYYWHLSNNTNYILRCNHGSGWNMKFRKEDSFNPEYLIRKSHEWCNLNYAYISGYEWQYECIKPGIVIQPDLGELLNWEFWCENGEIVNVCRAKKLKKNIMQYLSWYNKDGNPPEWYIGTKPLNFKVMSQKEREILNRMIPYVEHLCKGFKFVRVDLYSINNEVKFSEMTFTPCAGKLDLKWVKDEH